MPDNIPKNPYLEAAKLMTKKKVLSSLVTIVSNMQMLRTMQRSLDSYQPDNFEDSLGDESLATLHAETRKKIHHTDLKYEALKEVLGM